MKTRIALLPLFIGALAAPVALNGATLAVPVSQDTFVRSDQNVQGTETFILVGGHSSVGPFNSFYKFQLDAPELAGATINSVTLRLTSIAQAGSGTVNVNLHQLSAANSDWTEGGSGAPNASPGATFYWKDYASGYTINQIPWAGGLNNANFAAPTSYVGTVLGNYTGPANSDAGGQTFDLGNAALAALVAASIGGELNLVALDQTGNGTNFLRIASKENTTYAGPELIIDYTPAGGSFLVLEASQDTYVRTDQQVQGILDFLLVGGHASIGPFNSFYKFQLDAPELAGATINSVTLRLTSIAQAGSGTVNVNLYQLSAANSDWTEGTGTDPNASPGATFFWKDYASGFSANQVPWAGGLNNANFAAPTSYLDTVLGNYSGPANTADGGQTFNLGNAALAALVAASLGEELNLVALDQTGNGTNFLRIASKENTTYAGPELVINYTPAGGAVITLDAVHDTFVRSDAPNSAFGTDAQLLVGGHASVGPLNSFYKFDLGVPELAGATINSVILRLTSDSQAGIGTVDLKLFELTAGAADWIEGVSGAVGTGPYAEPTGCTFNNKSGEGLYATPWAGGNDNAGFLPGIDFINTELGRYAGPTNTASGGETYSFGLANAALVSAAQSAIGGPLDLIVMDETGATNFLRVASKENSAFTGPQLVINYTPGAPVATVPVLVGAIVGGSFTVTVPDSQPGYKYVLQTSGDLSPASWQYAGEQDGDGADLLFSVTAPAPGAKVFCRVEVSPL